MLDRIKYSNINCSNLYCSKLKCSSNGKQFFVNCFPLEEHSYVSNSVQSIVGIMDIVISFIIFDTVIIKCPH